MPRKGKVSVMYTRRPGKAVLKQRFYFKALELEKKTNFKRIEIEGLLRIFDKIIEKYQCPINKVIFKDILFNFFGFTGDLMMERIFRSVVSYGNSLTYDDWIYTMNIFIRGSCLQMANFAFTVYDQTKTGFISKECVRGYVRELYIQQVPEEDADEILTDLTDMVFSLMDKDGDGYVNRKDFIQSVMAEPLLLEVLGECFPSYKCKLTLDCLISQRREAIPTGSQIF